MFLTEIPAVYGNFVFPKSGAENGRVTSPGEKNNKLQNEPNAKKKKARYFPLNPACLMTGSEIVMVYEIIPTNNGVGSFIPWVGSFIPYIYIYPKQPGFLFTAQMRRG